MRRRATPDHVPAWLIAGGHSSTGIHLQGIIEKSTLDIHQVTDRVLRAEPPANGQPQLYLYSDKVDPTSDEFPRSRNFTGDDRTMVDEINLDSRRGDEAELSRDHFRRGRCGLQPRGEFKGGEGQGRSIQATAGIQIQFGASAASTLPSLKLRLSGALRAWQPRTETGNAKSNSSITSGRP